MDNLVPENSELSESFQPMEIEEVFQYLDERLIGIGKPKNSVESVAHSTERGAGWALVDTPVTSRAGKTNPIITDMQNWYEQEKNNFPQPNNFSTATEYIETLAKEFLILYLSHFEIPGLSQELIENIRNDTLAKEMDSLDPSYTTCLQILDVLVQLRAKMTQTCVNNQPKFSSKEQKEDFNILNPINQCEIKYSEKILKATNAFFMRWNQDAGKNMTSDERRELGLIHKGSMIDENKKEVIWSEAYTTEIYNLVGAYGELIKELSEILQKTSQADPYYSAIGNKIAYYTAVRDAYQIGLPEQGEEEGGEKELGEIKEHSKQAWERANKLFANQTAGRDDVGIHVHAMEWGYAKDAVQFILETSFRIPNENDEKINEMLTNNRLFIARHYRDLLRELGLIESPHHKKILELLEKHTTYKSYTVLGGGMELTFKPVGQALPNEHNERIEGGLALSTMSGQMKMRMQLIEQCFKDVFGERHPLASRFSKEEFDIDFAIGWLIASHEHGHILGVNDTTLTRLGKDFVGEYVEEWKATAGGMILTEWLPFLDGEYTTQQDGLKVLRTSILEHIGAASRYVATRSNDSSKPYLRKSIMLIRLMEEAGILKVKDEEINIDQSDHGEIPEDKIQNFYIRLHAQYSTLLGIYDHETHKDLRYWLSVYLQPSECMKFMFTKSDEKLGNKKDELPTLEKMCELSELGNILKKK